MDRSVLRQIKDIQVQADRHLKSTTSFDDIRAFGKYSEELKQYLLKHTNEEMIVHRLQEIPRIDKQAIQKAVSTGIAYSLFGIFGSYYRDRMMTQKALEYIREIQGKYASIEFLMKNYFD